jgi:predicted nucleotidyltransferase component of viral defense system
MDEVKTISSIDFNEIVSKHNFQRALLLKDYYLTLILYLIKDVGGLYFKGGTALNKIFLNHARLSEDIDFTLDVDEKEVENRISEIINNSGLFQNVIIGKKVEGFLRMIVGYNSKLGKGEIFIDLNKRAKLSFPPEEHEINHFYYPFIPKFSIKTVAKEELIAEKIAAAIGRNKPRDHYDVYMMLKKGIAIDLNLVKDKCHESGDEFSVIKMFNKAKMLKNRWDKDMNSLIAEPISFQEVIQFLARHFNLKSEKEKLKKEKA